jgi:hypothetical protein
MNHGGSKAATILSAPKSGPAAAGFDKAASKQEVDFKLDQAQEQLLALRRQQEELERQKGDLEELRRKQDEYIRGRAEMIDNLTRGLTTLEREQLAADRLAELCGATRAAFADYLDQLQALNDQQWNSGNIKPELSKALAIIENSRLEYNRARIKLDCLNPSAAQAREAALPVTQQKSSNWPELLRYLQLGAAASAPLILAGTIWVVLLLTVKR